MGRLARFRSELEELLEPEELLELGELLVLVVLPELEERPELDELPEQLNWNWLRPFATCNASGAQRTGGIPCSLHLSKCQQLLGLCLSS